MRTLLVSSSMNPDSRSNELARLAAIWLAENECEVSHIQLASNSLPDVADPDFYKTPIYEELSRQVREADNLIFASPVYNWSISSDLKKFIEVLGSTNSQHVTPFFDKLISFIFAAGLPHSYMIMANIATTMMLDFRCVINPHQAYLHNRHWTGEKLLTPEGERKLAGMLTAHMELGRRLQGMRLTGQWEV